MTFISELEDFGAFYERSYPLAFRTALGILGDPVAADDATQDAFVAAYRGRERFRGDAPARLWLLRIVVNAAIAIGRRRGRGPIEVRVVEDGGPVDGRPDVGASIADRLELFAALASLDNRQRAAVVLRFYHDLPYAEIAPMLGTTESNVGVILHRALRHLRATMEPPAVAAAPTESRDAT